MADKTISRREMLRRFAAVPMLLFVPKVNFTAWGGNSSKGKFVKIFDGKTLDGWHTNPYKIGHGTGGQWQVEKGVLTGQQDPPGSGNGGMLMTDRVYGDFELELDINPDYKIDSGIFLRTNNKGESFQIYCDHRDNGLIGFISTEGKNRMYIRPFAITGRFEGDKLVGYDTKPDGRKEAWQPDFLKYHCTPEEWKKAFKPGKWNTLRIRCTGKYPRITTWINGQMICDFDGETCPSPLYDKERMARALGREGHIALQVHGGKGWKNGSKCRWRNIRIKEL